MYSLNLSEERIVSELFLGLLGEECLFLTTKATVNEFKVIEEYLKYLTFEMTLIIEKIARLATNVRFIESHKRQRMPSDAVEGYSIQIKMDQPIQNSLQSESEAIKQAIVETIFKDYNKYLELADNMRLQHITNGDNSISLDDLIAFALTWYNRLNFVRNLLSLTDLNNGIQIFNLIYHNWMISCSKDWEYSILEHCLWSASNTLSRIFTIWLLDGEFERVTNIKETTPAQVKLTSRLSCSSFGDTSVLELQGTISKDKKEFTPKQLQSNSIRFEQEGGLIPTSIFQSKKLIELIIDIGKKVYFMKAFQCLRRYDNKIEERREVLLQSLKPEVWYNSTHRAPLIIALQKLNAIVCEDMMNELIKQQRMLDHLALIHTYFFTLRGDLFTELERILLNNFSKPTLYYQTPISIRKRTSNSSRTTEVLMNDALSKCSPPSEIADLMPLLSTDKAPRTKTFFESFGIAYNSKGKNTALGNTTEAIKNEFFSRDVLKVYRKVFSVSANLQMIRFQLDEISHQFNHKTCKKLKRENADTSFGFAIQLNLFNIRIFLTRLANYFFEDVLLLESTTILRRVQKESNPSRLVSRQEHDVLLNRTKKALFLYTDAASVFEAIVNTIRQARKFVNAVEDYCEVVDKDNINQQQKRQSFAMLEYDRNRTNRQSIGSIGTKNGKIIDQNKMDSLKFMLRESISQFKKSHSQLRTNLENFLTSEQSNNPSSYWPKFYALIFEENYNSSASLSFNSILAV